MMEFTYSETETKDVVAKAITFASLTKLAELFFESLPQFGTQLLMTSAKGEGGLRALSWYQMASVVGSAVTVGCGVANYVVSSRGVFLLRNHRYFTSMIVIGRFHDQADDTW
jgi:hypothetical protein